MSLHKAIDISNHQSTINFEELSQQGYDTVIIECGSGYSPVSSDIPNPGLDSHYENAVAAGFNIGFYFWFYNNVSPQDQAQEFVNFISGKTSNCKFFIDLESGSMLSSTNYNNESLDTLIQEMVESMKSICAKQGLILQDSDFGIYCPRSYAVQVPVSLSKYLLWLSCPVSTIPDETDTPPSYQGMNFSNWAGWQWDITNLDRDIFQSTAYFSSPVTIGKTQGTVSSSNSLKVGDYVKLLDTATNFAPNLIPSNDKGINYTIESIDGSMCKLSGINEWVNFEFLNLIHSKTPPSQPISSLPHPKGTNDAATQIYNICKNAGWSKEAICGMLGNLSWESSLDPTKEQYYGGGGYGLAQWSLQDLEIYANQAGVSDYNTIPGQMAIIIYQMNNNGGGQYIHRSTTPSEYWIEPSDYIVSTQNPSFLAKAWMYSYEDPGIPDTYNRVEGAEYWYAYFNQN